MGIRVKTEYGYMYITFAIQCDQFLIDKKGDGSPKCIAKKIRPECETCSLINATQRIKFV